MSARTHQMKWAVLLQMRDNPPGSVEFDDPERWGDVCVDDALGAFSRDVSTGSYEERVAAAEALGWMLDQRAVTPLLRALADSAPEVRRAATRAFSSFLPAPRGAVGPLLDAVRDPDAGVRFYAAGALIRHRCLPAVRSALGAVVHDPVATVRQQAEVALRGAYEFDHHTSYIAATLSDSTL